MMEIVEAYTLLSSGQPKAAEAKLTGLRARPAEAIAVSLNALNSLDIVENVKILAAQMVVSLAKHADVAKLIDLVKGRTLISSVQMQLHVGIAVAVLHYPSEKWLDCIWSNLSPEDAMGVVEMVAVRCRSTPSKHSIFLGQTREVIALLEPLFMPYTFSDVEGPENHIVIYAATVRVVKAWVDLRTTSSPDGEAYLLAWAESSIFQHAIRELIDQAWVWRTTNTNETFIQGWSKPKYALHLELFQAFFRRIS